MRYDEPLPLSPGTGYPSPEESKNISHTAGAPRYERNKFWPINSTEYLRESKENPGIDQIDPIGPLRVLAGMGKVLQFSAHLVAQNE